MTETNLMKFTNTKSGKVHEIDTDKLSKEVINKAVYFGLKRKLDNSHADIKKGSEGFAEESEELFADMVERIVAGEWVTSSRGSSIDRSRLGAIVAVMLDSAIVKTKKAANEILGKNDEDKIITALAKVFKVTEEEVESKITAKLEAKPVEINLDDIGLEL